MYEHIVVPFDGTAAAQRAGMIGADLSTVFGAELVLATAADLTDARLIAVKQAAADLSDGHATVWIEPSSSETDAIRAVVEHRAHTLVCMYSNGRVGLRRAVYGSFAERLLHELDVPVLVLGPRSEHSSIVNLRSLLVCIDGSPTSDAALALAMSWARVMPLNASVVHIRRSEDEPRLDLVPAIETLRTCCKVVESIEDVNADPVDGVVDLARHSSASMIVMATHDRTDLQQRVQGSFTAELCHRSPLPVLVQRGPLMSRPDWVGARDATPGSV